MRTTTYSLTALAVVLALAGCATSAPATPATPKTATIKGTIEVADTSAVFDTVEDSIPDSDSSGDTCTALTDGGYTDIADGAEADVVSASGKILGIGTLGGGKIGADKGCVFSFTVPDVSTSGTIYGVRIGNSARGTVHFTRAELLAGPSLTLGSSN